MFKRFFTFLVDKNYVKVALNLRWLVGTPRFLTYLVNGVDLNKISERITKLEAQHFFSGKNEINHRRLLLKALFTHYGDDGSTFSQHLQFANSLEQNNSHTPINKFFTFIEKEFFNHDELKQELIKLVFMHPNEKDNALAQAAGIKDAEPLIALMTLLEKANCFTNEEYKEKFIDAAFKLPKQGETPLFRAIESNQTQRSEKLHLMLNYLTQAGCFSGNRAEAHKTACRKAILLSNNYDSLLLSGVWNKDNLETIVNLAKQADCFSPTNQQSFFDALVTPADRLNSTPLHYVTYTTSSLGYLLMHAGIQQCLQGTQGEKNKQKIIKTIFTPDRRGETPLYHAFSNEESAERILKFLSDLDVFDDKATQQLFIDTLFIEDRYKKTCFNQLPSQEMLFKCLKKINWFSGSNAFKNKQAYISAILKPNLLSNNSILFDHKNSAGSFKRIIKQLEVAGGFSTAKNKKQFIQAVFYNDKHGENLLSNLFCPQNIICVLEKLNEAGCFDNKTTKKRFLRTIHEEGNSLFLNAANDLKSYLTLRKYLLKAGCTKKNLTNLLNKPVKTNLFDLIRLSEITPLGRAIKKHYLAESLLSAKLRADGAILTPKQQDELFKAHAVSEELFEEENRLIETPPKKDPKAVISKEKSEQLKNELLRTSSIFRIKKSQKRTEKYRKNPNDIETSITFFQPKRTPKEKGKIYSADDCCYPKNSY